MINEIYDKFFGDGYLEKQYKSHIVIFAEKCVKAALLSKRVAICDSCQGDVVVYEEICTVCGMRFDPGACKRVPVL